MDDCCNLSCTGYIEPVVQTNSLIIADASNNTIILSNNQTYFSNNNNSVVTKIDQNGRLLVYHNSETVPTGYSVGWWDVEGKIVEILTNIYRNSTNNNTIITSANDLVVTATNEIQFTKNSNTYAKINSDGKLVVYHNSNAIPPGYPMGFWDVEQKLVETLMNDEGLRVDLTAAQIDISFISTTLNNLMTVDLPATVATLEAQILLREQILTFNNPLNKSNSVVTLNYDNSLTLDASNNLKVVKTASNPITITGNNFSLNYDSTLTLVGNYLSVDSATGSKWRTLGNDIYNNNIGNVGIGTTTPQNKLEVLNGSINTNDYKYNNNSLFTYLPYQSPTPSGTYTTTTIDANTFVYTFTGTGQLFVPSDAIIDVLLVGAGGRGGINLYAGGGGAGEVVYYPQYAISAGTYDITVGIDSATTSTRISKITKTGVNQLVALGGGDGAYWNYEFTAERVFPPKAYNTATTRSASTIMGRSCQKHTMTLTTASITYGSGTYELYMSSIYSTSTVYDGYRMFDYDNTTTINRWAGAAGQYSLTTGAVAPTTTQYFIDNTYKGDWFVIKLPYPIALTKYTIYQTTGLLDRAPKNFRVYGSIAGTSFTLLQDITGATYTSRIYTNTALSTNTTPYQWYAFVVNNLVGGTNSSLLDIVEFKLYGKEPINVYSSAIGGSGGGGWYNPNVPALVKKGSTFAISQNAQYSKATAGYNPVDFGTFFGGSGGSATGTGRFTTTITGTTTSYGLGGYPTGGTAYATPVATNYGDGGSSGLTQGLGFQGVCILRIRTTFITKYNHYLSWDKLLNIQIGDGLSVDPLNGNRITTSWTKNLTNNDIYNNNGANVGINCYSTTTILEKFHISDLGGQKGKFLLGTDYDHIKLSHDGYNAYLDIGGADSYFSIRLDYPPDWVGYNSMYYYDIITILGDGSGFVGIQNIAPTCALDVFGSFNASGNITAGGDLNCRNAYFNNQNISGISTATITQINGTAISLSGSMNVPTLSPTYINSCTSASIATVNATTVNATTYNGLVNFTNGSWNTSADGKLRMYFAANSHSYWGTYGNHVFRNYIDADIATFDSVGNLTCGFECFSVTNTDHLGIYINFPTVGSTATKRIYALFNTFTGYHRCFIEDPLFDINDWENFRKEHEGRVVISSGKIKTHIKDGEDVKEWTAFTGKEGITIEDALPIIEFSRKKKDKRIYGVLGSYNRCNSAIDRMIVNGCGEGAIWVVNTNGNLENGDLLQTSNEVGYAEKADDDLIRNYTVGKVVMDCDFELDSPNYKCEIIDSERDIRRAYLACIYMAS